MFKFTNKNRTVTDNNIFFFVQHEIKQLYVKLCGKNRLTLVVKMKFFFYKQLTWVRFSYSKCTLYFCTFVIFYNEQEIGIYENFHDKKKKILCK